MSLCLTKPCSNCPFRKQGFVALVPGRINGIKQTLSSDFSFFKCHKTVYDKDLNEKMDSEHKPCFGALSIQWKERQNLPIVARLDMMAGNLTPEHLETHETFDSWRDMKQAHKAKSAK